MSTPRSWRLLVALVAATLLVAAAVPVGAAGPPGNNGTVKIHDGVKADDNHPEVANDPHVGCPFHVHFFFGDGEQAGNPTGDDWWIAGHPPGGAGSLSGEYIALGNGEYWTGPLELPAGHYKLTFTGAGKNLNAKHKVFWVEDGCDGEGGGGDPGEG
ncbi:MAG TPA: hypothetical protein VIA02_10145 [Candidatus Limnocylindria bacterium]|jgi:hypothetical protein